MHPVRTILHATDFSTHSDCALQFAGKLAAAHGARLVVFHVLRAAEPPVWLFDRMAGTTPWTVDSYEALEQRIGLLRASNPGLRADLRVAEGIPAEEILRAADADCCDLIVMGTQGRTGLERVLAGSVAAEVMSKATCPVLTVKDGKPRPAKRSNTPQGAPANTSPTSSTHSEASKMSTDLNRVIVGDSLCSRCFIPAKEIYHSHFPEIRAECGSLSRGAAHLAKQLVAYRQGANDAWHREVIDVAIDDVTAFHKSMPESPHADEASCQCQPRAACLTESTLPGGHHSLDSLDDKLIGVELQGTDIDR